MRIFIVLLLTTLALSAQLISRNELRSTNTALIARINATNNALVATIRPKQSGSMTLSNFVAFLTANGITNISGGSNVVLYVVNGTLVINGISSGSGTTSNIPVLQGTNLIFQVADFDAFNVGVLIPTNTVYVTMTNAAVSQATNYVADFARSEQTIQVVGPVHLAHATNLWIGVTNAYTVVSLPNFSGSDQTLSIPAAWKETLNFPTVITNGTILEVMLKNYGGLDQSNITARATQF